MALHVSYVPRSGGVNKCYAILTRSGFVGVHDPEHAPPGFGPAIRMDRLQAEGPLPQFASQHDVAIKAILVEIQDLHQIRVPRMPCPLIGTRIGDILTRGTSQWASAQRTDRASRLPDIVDWWLNVFHAAEEHADWAAMVFQAWGQHVLPEIID